MSETRKVWPWQEPDIRCEWAKLTSKRCTEQATYVARFPTDVACYCDGHARWISTADRIEPLIRDPRVAAIVCASIFGVHDDPLLRLNAADPDEEAVLLDYLEGIGAHRPEFAWPAQEPREWLDVDEHGTGNNPHVWLEKLTTWQAGEATINIVSHQCTCGLTLIQHRMHEVARISHESMGINADLLGQRTQPTAR
jgi:hypothetical protein